MFLKNTSALLFLSLLVGVASNLGLIGAQSFLLSKADAVYTVYGNFAAGLLFSIFLRNLKLGTRKYAYFAVWGLCLFALALALLSLDVMIPLAKAVVWYLLACFGNAMMMWIVSELTIRHLDPARANTYFSYLTACFEGGTVCAILLLKLNHIVLSANQTLWLVLSISLLSVLLILLQFVPRKNFEIVYSERTAEESAKNVNDFRPLLVFFTVMTVAFATMRVTEDYLVKVVLKHGLGTYDAIRSMTENYFSVSSALIVVGSLITGKAIEKLRLSPIRLLNIQGLVMGAMSVLCLSTRYFYLFILFEVVRRVLDNCIYSPANQMITGAFISEQRAKLKAQHSLYYWAIVPIVLSVIFSVATSLAFFTETTFLLILILTSACIALFALFRFRQILASTMYQFLSSSHKAMAIIAAHILSYIRPPDYVERMTQILSTSPKKLLRKTIILGLGYTHSDDSVEIIKQQFHSEKEEIQIAGLDALAVAKTFRSTQFLLNILKDKAQPRTQRVRVNAMAIIAGIYGKKAIPFLLDGLDQSDPRGIANTLEVLSYFKDKKLQPYFFSHLRHDTPRVKANALLGLAQYRNMRKPCKDVVRQLFQEDDIALTASLLYVIGKLKDKDFRSEVLRIYENQDLRNNPRLVNVLAWALVRLNEKSGFQLASEIVFQGGKDARFMHFFSMYPQETRYDVIKYFISLHQAEPYAIHQFGESLKKSIYDFHEELEYLKVYGQSLRSSLQQNRK